MSDSRLVYSTEWQNGKAPHQTSPALPPAETELKVRRETQGRKGAAVITIQGVAEADLKPLASLLKKKCGSGGAIKQGVIEIQGEKLEQVMTLLQASGYKTKKIGG